MATFKQKIEQLVGTIQSTTSDTDLNDFLTATAGEVLQAIPDKIAIRYTTDNEQSNANGFDTSNYRVIGVMRDGYEAQEVSIGQKAAITDTNSIHYRSARTPVYYFDNEKIYIQPDPSGSEKAQIKAIAYPTVAHGDSSVTGFIDTAEYAVVLGSCVKYLHDVLNTALNTNEDVEMAQSIKMQIDSLNALYVSEIERIKALT